MLKQGHYDGAYYLAGYVAECGLKACIAKKTKQYDFPDKGVVNKSYTHDLNSLVTVAGLELALEQQRASDHVFRVNWIIVTDWREDSRYQRKTEKQAEDLYRAIADPRHGVFQWSRRHW